MGSVRRVCCRCLLVGVKPASDLYPSPFGASVYSLITLVQSDDVYRTFAYAHHDYLLDVNRFRLPVRAPFTPALRRIPEHARLSACGEESIDAIATVGSVLSLLHLKGWTFTTIICKLSGLMKPC